MSERTEMQPVSEGAAGATMLDTNDVARLLKCSDRHVTNLRKEGRMPPPVKLGVLVRWPRKVIEDWIAAGCPAVGESAEADSAGDRQVA